MADAAGTTVWKWDQQEPFGNNVADENPSGLGAFDLPLRLPGQYFDKETNLHYNYIRDYDPSIGRYAESDPIGLWAGLNTYSYVSSSPLMASDLLGLAKWTGTVDSLGVLVYGHEVFDLESECKCGYKLRTQVKATYYGFGLSAIRSRSKVQFEDHFACPNAMAFDGIAFHVSLGAGIGDGKSFDFIVLGVATSPVSGVLSIKPSAPQQVSMLDHPRLGPLGVRNVANEVKRWLGYSIYGAATPLGPSRYAGS